VAESSDGVQVVTAEGVKEEIAELTAVSEDDDSTRRAEIEASPSCSWSARATPTRAS
jgi:hypothetical protein